MYLVVVKSLSGGYLQRQPIMNYRAIPRIANSDLTEFKNKLLFGRKPIPIFSQALAFGTLFHDHLLLTPGVEPAGKGATAIKRMLEVIRNDADFPELLKKGICEQAHFWEDERTKLLCKARIDLRVPAESLIVDVKTTSATSYTEFLTACQTYDYDRQAAFYLDGCQQGGQGVTKYQILGVQKQKPHQLFKLEHVIDDSFINYGRRKYQSLLRSWKQQPYQPTSWQIE